MSSGCGRRVGSSSTLVVAHPRQSHPDVQICKASQRFVREFLVRVPRSDASSYVPAAKARICSCSTCCAAHLPEVPVTGVHYPKVQPDAACTWQRRRKSSERTRLSLMAFLHGRDPTLKTETLDKRQERPDNLFSLRNVVDPCFTHECASPSPKYRLVYICVGRLEK